MQVFLQTLMSGLSFGAIYALVALGFSLVYRTMGLVNFAHGNIAMIGAFILATTFVTHSLPFPLAMAVAMGATAMVGVVIERVLRRLEHKDFDLMLIGTIGFGLVLESLAIIVWGASGDGVPNPLGSTILDIAGMRIRPYDLLVIGCAALATVLLRYFLEHSKRGIAMQAVAMDHEAATAMGVNVGRSNGIAFAIGSGLAALAGGLAAPVLYVNSTFAVELGISGFAAAILGGFGNVNGAIVGGLVFGLIQAFAAGQFEGYGLLVTFVVFAIVIVVKPTGILGERTVNRA